MNRATATPQAKLRPKPNQRAVEFRILGPLAALTAGRSVPLGGPKQRLVLAVLILDANRVVSADRLIDLVWGEDPPEAARATLQAYISRLRKALGSDIIAARGPGYVLEVSASQVDASRFQSLVESAKDLPPEKKAGQLAEALGLWRGPALSDFASVAWSLGEAARLNELRMHAVEEEIAAELALGRHREVIGELESLVNGNPLRERLCSQLMLALYRSGRQAEASAVYQKTRTKLVDELGMEPGPELRSLLTRILKQDPELALPIRSIGQRHIELPLQLTSFVGRQAEVKEVVELVRQSRLVTLVGAGGIGKTRLAIEAARAATETETEIDSVFFVDLAPLRAPELLEQSVISALGGRKEAAPASVETIVGLLGASRTLVLLDNCEHLIETVARLADQLLRQHPGVSLLATSREPLRVAAERRWLVSQFSDEDCVRLFVERARHVNPKFVTTQEEEPSLIRLCRGLDGLPLAIELAAARISQMPIGEIAAQIDDRFALLSQSDRTAPGRHHSLDAAIDWSYELLTEAERYVFIQLSVFAGGFDATAARAVAGCTVADLAALVDKSMVVQDPPAFDGRARYRVLETLRQFAALRLHDGGYAVEASRRHFDYFAQVVAQAAPELNGRGMPVWLQRLHENVGNLRAALEFGLNEDPDAALAMAVQLEWFWLGFRYVSEGRWWLQRLGSAARSAPVRTMAAALHIAADLGLNIGEADAAQVELGQALALWRQIDDPAGISRTLVHLARATGLTRSDFGKQTPLLDEALVEARRADDAFLIMEALSYLGLALSCTESFDQGRALQQEAETIARKSGALGSIAWVIWRDALAYFWQGDLHMARLRCEEGLETGHGVEHLRLNRFAHALLARIDLVEHAMASARDHYRVGLEESMQPGYTAVQGLAVVASQSGQYVRALKLAGALSEVGQSPRLLILADQEAQIWIDTARRSVDPQTSDAAWRAGKAMTKPELIAYMLSDEDGDSRTDVAAGGNADTKATSPGSV